MRAGNSRMHFEFYYKMQAKTWVWELGLALKHNEDWKDLGKEKTPGGNFRP